MREPRDEDLILYFYGEADDTEEIRALLASSSKLRSRYETLGQTLEAAEKALVVPERPESYGTEVWARLQPKLNVGAGASPAPTLRSGLERLRFWFDGSRWALAGVAAAAVLLLVIGFQAGRFWPRPGGDREGVADVLPSAARERILIRTVAFHLESSERLLTELSNAGTDGAVDFSAERRWAEDLLTANRLYRQSARQGGRLGLASLLDDLEPFLLELAHAPAEIPADELDDLRARIEEQALLFKVRIVSRRLEHASALHPHSAGKQTL